MEEKLFVREQLLLKEVQENVRKMAEKYHLEAGGKERPDFVELGKAAKVILSESRMSLDIYGVYYGTDKSSFCINGDDLRPSHDYLRYYEMLFCPFRFQEFLLVELGCETGSSLRMWQDYFHQATIVGVDIMESVRQYEADRIHIVVGDATSRSTCDAIKEYAGDRKPLIIIDDASHAWGDQRRSMEMFWEFLAPGGFYVIEDLECGAKGAYAGYVPQVMDAQTFFDFVQERCQVLRWPLFSSGRWANVFSNWKNSPRHADLPEVIRRIEEELDACLFIHGAVILRKR